WVMAVRKDLPEVGEARAYLARKNFADFATTTDQDLVPWLRTDELDKPDPAPGLGDRPQLHKFNAVAYESVMLGMFGVYFGPSFQIAQKEKRPMIIDLEVGFSRDGTNYFRPNRRPFIASAREEGAWNRGFLHSAG